MVDDDVQEVIMIIMVDDDGIQEVIMLIMSPVTAMVMMTAVTVTAVIITIDTAALVHAVTKLLWFMP